MYGRLMLYSPPIDIEEREIKIFTSDAATP
jgi:hypothetical protein